MYINPFVAGVLCTLLSEFVLLIAWVIMVNTNKK